MDAYHSIHAALASNSRSEAVKLFDAAMTFAAERCISDRVRYTGWSLHEDASGDNFRFDLHIAVNGIDYISDGDWSFDVLMTPNGSTFAERILTSESTHCEDGGDEDELASDMEDCAQECVYEALQWDQTTTIEEMREESRLKWEAIVKAQAQTRLQAQEQAQAAT